MLPAEYVERPYWEIPEREPHGEDDIAAIYHAVGHCLSAWEELEVALAALFSILVESPSIAAGRAYGSLASAKGRVEMLERAGEVYFADHHPDQRSAFNQITKVVGCAGTRRNDIGHGIAASFAVSTVPGGGYYLIAPSYNARRYQIGVDLEDMTGDPFSFSGARYATRADKSTSLARASTLSRGTLATSVAL